MKLNLIDILFFMLALVGLVMFGITMGVNGCRDESGLLYFAILPIVGMIGIYFWQVGKRIGNGLKK